MGDWATKLLLAVIALALWVDVVGRVVPPAWAQSDRLLQTVERRLGNIERDLDRLQRGSCANAKLC